MILLVGAGAVGTILAAHVAAGGKEPLKLYVRDKDLARMEAVSELRVDPVAPGKPSVRAPKPVLTQSLDLAGVDYLFICVKFPDLEKLLAQLPPIPPGCTLVSTLNGISALRTIRERLPQARLAPMTIMFNGQLLGPLHARLTTRAQVFTGTDDARLLACFGSSGMQSLPAAGESAAWGKLLINLANAICAITHTTFKDLLTDRDVRAVYAAVLDESVGLLQRAGIAYQLPMPIPYRLYRTILLRGGLLPWWFAKVRNGLQEGAYPSMVADVEHGRRTEVAQLNGEVVQLAANNGGAAPLNSAIVQLVGSMEGKVPPPYLTPKQLRQRLGI
ncbi:MAG TPA: ketopantoate reductase C-terminal domain-containing protein [Solimonas sp.]|nr:ketopantoate reductase C-terminal domain-containing protein [Solimonas sp.]